MLFTKLQKLITFVDKNKAQKIFTKSKSALASFADVKEENLKSIDEMPTPPGLPLIGNLQMFLNKENAEDLTKFVKKLQADYGNIIRYSTSQLVCNSKFFPQNLSLILMGIPSTVLEYASQEDSNTCPES